MGGDFGSIQAMRDALRANKALLGERIRYFERGKQFAEIKKAYQKAKKENSSKKVISKEELEEIRHRVVRIRRKDQFIKLSIFSGVLLIVGFIVYLNRDFLKPETNHQTIVTIDSIERRERVLYCIEDGDRWLRKNGWHNAIFQYEEALRLSPENTAVKKRLAMAYTYRCRATKVDCEKAKTSIEELIKSEPTNPKNYELLASYWFGVEDSLAATVALGQASSLSSSN
ncbi:MAG: hypothetical protein H6601_09065 [Flavobacteriales bacterium]|nr:hypothetical protein [Flavobacteriales bacterium]MCB9204245.1 hypothetical protein [Flavobacteriales bacterium]